MTDTEVVSPEHMKRISGHLHNWDNADFEDGWFAIADITAVCFAFALGQILAFT